MLIHFINEEREKLPRHTFHTFVNHARLAHEVTDTDFGAQNGSTHGGIFCSFPTVG